MRHEIARHTIVGVIKQNSHSIVSILEAIPGGGSDHNPFRGRPRGFICVRKGGMAPIDRFEDSTFRNAMLRDLHIELREVTIVRWGSLILYIFGRPLPSRCGDKS
ncbi:MAG: hypothetical protein PVS2B2_12970 [Candidatus Acidiferrum sp.]